jgi:predicted methyltransferase
MFSNEILLLKIVEANARISLLRNRGLSHSQVAMMIKKQQDEGNIVITDENISLTPQGSKLLQENISKVAPKEKDRWILPQEHLYNQPIPFDKIILPKNKKI